ncbi:hypothetical protein Tco_0332236 [Tanacetum coccineum]
MPRLNHQNPPIPPKQHTNTVGVQSGCLFFAIGLVAATFVGSSVYINYQKNKLDANDSNAPPHFLNDFDTPPLPTDSDTKEVIGSDTNCENLKNRYVRRVFAHVELQFEVHGKLLEVFQFEMSDYALWEVIKNGNTAPKTTVVEGVEKVIPPTTAEEKAQKRLEVKARTF